MSLPVGTATSILSTLKTLTVSLLSLYNQLSTWLAESILVEQQTGAYGSSRQVIFSTWKCTARGVSVADASHRRQPNLSQNWLLVEYPLKILWGGKNVKFHLPVIFILIKPQTVSILYPVHGRHTEVTNSMSSFSACSEIEILRTVLYNRHNNKTCNISTNVTLKRSRKHCCRGKAISITYSGCVFVPSDIQHAKRMLDTWVYN
jgi:hypothetical protein